MPLKGEPHPFALECNNDVETGEAQKLKATFVNLDMFMYVVTQIPNHPTITAVCTQCLDRPPKMMGALGPPINAMQVQSERHRLTVTLAKLKKQ